MLGTLLLYIFIFIISFGLYSYLKFQVSGSKYWSRRNVIHLPPRFLVGNFLTLNFKISIGEFLANLYLEHKKTKLFGYWAFNRPTIAIFDLDIIKNILVRDFSIFHDRVPDVGTDDEPLASHLFNLSGQEWRNMRVKLSPTFTTGKMKMMYPTMIQCANEFENFLKPIAERGDDIEVKDILSRFTTNIIASCAFGIEIDSLNNPDNDFRVYGKKIFQPSSGDVLKRIFTYLFPPFKKLFSITRIPGDVTTFFINTVKDTMEYRKLNDIQRNDFMQLLIELKEKGKIADVDKSDEILPSDQVVSTKFTLNEAAAQAFVFFLAGFETSASTMAYTLYELANNQEVQNQLKTEIKSACDQETGELSYDGINKLEYLDWVIQETLRKYPVVPMLMRRTTKDYKFADLNVEIPKGQMVVIPLLGISRDPDIFPEPEKFDPLRFRAEEKEKRHKFSTIPFGEGPRNCIGSRFGLLQTKVGLVTLMKRFTILPCEATPKVLSYDPKGFVLTVNGGLHLKLIKD